MPLKDSCNRHPASVIVLFIRNFVTTSPTLTVMEKSNNGSFYDMINENEFHCQMLSTIILHRYYEQFGLFLHY